LRGGAIAILLFTVGLHAHDLLTIRLSRYSALLRLCAAAFVVESAPGFEALEPHWRILIHVVSCSAPLAFWIMAAALFNDDFRVRWYHALAWLGLAALAWREMFGWPRALLAVHDIMALLFVPIRNISTAIMAASSSCSIACSGPSSASATTSPAATVW
jgi:hypothetical protein